MKRSIVSLGLIVVLTVFLVGGSPSTVDPEVTVKEPVLSVDSFDSSPAAVTTALPDELAEDDFLFRSDPEERFTTVEYELETDTETITRQLEVGPDRGVVRTSYFATVQDQVSCEHAVNYIMRIDGADSVPKKDRLFDVCENVRSVGSDGVELRWDSPQEGKELTIDVERDKKAVSFTYKMPLFNN